jgi:hypothetical protein
MLPDGRIGSADSLRKNGNPGNALTDALSVSLGRVAAVKYNQPFLDSVPDFL